MGKSTINRPCWMAILTQPEVESLGKKYGARTRIQDWSFVENQNTFGMTQTCKVIDHHGWYWRKILDDHGFHHGWYVYTYILWYIYIYVYIIHILMWLCGIIEYHRGHLDLGWPSYKAAIALGASWSPEGSTGWATGWRSSPPTWITYG